MWTYIQKTGELSFNGAHVENGYSGADEGKNNPSLQAVHDVGPIPQGEWTITGPPFNSPDHGPFVLRLMPSNGTNTFGRAGFLMHGDSSEHPGCASKGCIIMPRTVREKVWTSGDTELRVFALQPTEDATPEVVA